MLNHIPIVRVQKTLIDPELRRLDEPPQQALLLPALPLNLIDSEVLPLQSNPILDPKQDQECFLIDHLLVLHLRLCAYLVQDGLEGNWALLSLTVHYAEQLVQALGALP